MNENTQTITKKAVPVVATKELDDNKQKLIEIARMAHKKFGESPNVFVAEQSSDEHYELVKVYAPNAHDKIDRAGKVLVPATRHAYFCEASKLGIFAARGYEPVVDDNGNFVVNGGGDVLTTCPRAMYEARESRQHETSNVRIKQFTKKPKGSSVGADVEQAFVDETIEVKRTNKME